MNLVTDRKSIMREKVLQTAIELFTSEGIRSVKMDDIASSLKISKRTLYELYANKKDLIIDVAECIMHSYREQLVKFAENCDNSMDIVVEFFRKQATFYQTTNPLFFSEMRRYPEVVDCVSIHRQDMSEKNVQFFKRAVQEGYFRSDVNFGLIEKIARDVGELFRSRSDYEQYDNSEIFFSYICTLVRGVCTEKGVAKFDDFLRKLKNQQR